MFLQFIFVQNFRLLYLILVLNYIVMATNIIHVFGLLYCMCSSQEICDAKFGRKFLELLLFRCQDISSLRKWLKNLTITDTEFID